VLNVDVQATTAATIATNITALPTVTSSPYSPLDPCTECTWHASDSVVPTCTNSPLYPSAWDIHPAARAHYFFQNAEDCCNAHSPSECNVLNVDLQVTDVNTGENDFINLGPVTIDDFSGDPVLPFDFGSPPQWELEASPNPRSGSHSHSLTNIPIDGLGATADLTLRIHVDDPSKLSCTAHVDTGMPFELFMFLVNGEQRKVYYRVEQELVTIAANLNPGEHTVVFRVMNAEFDPGMEREVSQFGTGRVGLYGCSVSSEASFSTEKDVDASLRAVGSANSTESPTESPAVSPTVSSTRSPSENPTNTPSVSPTASPTENLTDSPTDDPCPTKKNKHYCQDDSLCEWTAKKGKKDKACYRRSTKIPTESSTVSPTTNSTTSPSENPTNRPTKSPTESPTENPSGSPTESSTAPTVVSTPGGTMVAGAKSSKLFKDKSERPSKKPTDSPTF